MYLKEFRYSLDRLTPNAAQTRDKINFGHFVFDSDLSGHGLRLTGWEPSIKLTLKKRTLETLIDSTRLLQDDQ